MVYANSYAVHAPASPANFYRRAIRSDRDIFRVAKAWRYFALSGRRDPSREIVLRHRLDKRLSERWELMAASDFIFAAVFRVPRHARARRVKAVAA